MKPGGPLAGPVPAATFHVGGETLRGELREAGAPRGAVLLVHGFNSGRKEFGPLPGLLAEAGYHALAFDQRGYGESDGEPGRTSVERAVEDIQAAAHWLAGETGTEGKLGIVGHSLGGAYAIAALARTQWFGAGVVAHPVDRLFDELNPLEKLGYHVIGRWSEWRVRRGGPPGTIPYKNAYENLFVSEAAAKEARAEGFLLGRVSLANYRPAVTMSAATWARSVAQPVLVIASPHDRAVKPAHLRKVHDALGGPKAWLEHRGGHSCFRDLDGPMLAQATIGWLDRHLAGGP